MREFDSLLKLEFIHKKIYTSKEDRKKEALEKKIEASNEKFKKQFQEKVIVICEGWTSRHGEGNASKNS